MNRTRSDFLAPVRLLLFSFGLAAVWIAISFFVGTTSAHADEAGSRSLLGSVVSGVEIPLTDAAAPVKELTAVVPSVPSAVLSPVAEVVQEQPAPRLVAPIASTVDTLVAPAVSPVAKTVAPTVAPAASTVDSGVDALPGAERAPKVSDALGVSPLADLIAPATDLVDEVLVGVTTPVTEIIPPPLPPLLSIPGLPSVPGGPAVSDPAVAPTPIGSPDAPEVVVAVDLAMSALPAASERTTSVSSTSTISSWVADLNSGLGVSPAASARPHPDPVPRGPAENGGSALPSSPATSGGATAAGLSGQPSAAEITSSFAVMLISGALLSHAENDVLPSPLPLELSSTPD